MSFLGENCDPQEPLREAIVTIIAHHEENRAQNGSVCMMGKFHNVLYVAIKLCYDWQLKDTQTVLTLLESIYCCEKSFERIFIGAMFGNKAPHYIAGWKSDFDSQEENLRAVVYYIDHATNGGLVLPSGNEGILTRFIDLPIESCGKSSALRVTIQLAIPDKLHILLRYGALLVDNREITGLLLQRLMEFCHVYPYNIVACLQLILRVVPTLEYYNREDFFDNFSDLIDDGVVPVNRCGIAAPELKHLCRCAIRRRLWENYQLPNGIRYLEIPETLQKYVDIMED